MSHTPEEIEVICKRRENFGWNNGFTWGITVAGLIFLIAVAVFKIWG